MNFILKLINQEIWVEIFWNYLKIESNKSSPVQSICQMLQDTLESD